MEDVDEQVKMSSTIETMNPWEPTKSGNIIGKTELTTDPNLLIRLNDNLCDPEIDEKPKQNPKHNDPKVRAGPKIRVKLYDNPEKDVTNHGFRKIDSERMMKDRLAAKQKLNDLFNAVEERLSPLEMRTCTSLFIGFKSHRISYGDFVTSLLQLIEEHKDLYQRLIEITYGDKEKQGDGAVETRHDEDSLSNPKTGTGLKIRVKVDYNPKERESAKINLEGKNQRRILFPKDLNQPERPRKKRRTSKRVVQITPNYRPIPKKRQSQVSSTVLNNTCMVMKHDIKGGKKLSRIEEEINEWEDHMYEVDMLKGALESAVESARKVISGEMRLKDLGGKFYRCVETLYDEDMFEVVREHHQRALPVILQRLEQKLLEITAAREDWKPVWKQTCEKLFAKQRDSISLTSEVKKTTIRIRF